MDCRGATPQVAQLWLSCVNTSVCGERGVMDTWVHTCTLSRYVGGRRAGRGAWARAAVQGHNVYYSAGLGAVSELGGQTYGTV